MTTEQRLQEWLNGDQTTPAKPEQTTKRGRFKLIALVFGSLALAELLGLNEGRSGLATAALAWAMIMAVILIVWAVVASIGWLQIRKEERDERENRKSGRA